MFNMLKFRSMRADSIDYAGARSASPQDDRITPLGRFMRRTSLDELPQLLNVLKGEMSIVGPRPHALGSTAEDSLFWQIDRRYYQRHAIKPGITGLAQVRGFRGATDHRHDLTDRLQSDLEYVSGWTVWRDLKIIAGTFLVLAHRRAF
jgi:lipopolysaccharide/colanic/teichoic acid biosynthesis glycosyltransferase